MIFSLGGVTSAASLPMRVKNTCEVPSQQRGFSSYLTRPFFVLLIYALLFGVSNYLHLWAKFIPKPFNFFMVKIVNNITVSHIIKIPVTRPRRSIKPRTNIRPRSNIMPRTTIRPRTTTRPRSSTRPRRKIRPRSSIRTRSFHRNPLLEQV